MSSSTQSGPIAVLWMRFGPYHLARLRAAAERMRREHIAVVGIEIAGNDSIYAWEVASGEEGFRRVTLFPDGDYTRLSPKDIRKAVAKALDDIRPRAVAINGWSVPEARAALGWTRSCGAKAILMSETFPGGSSRPSSRVKEWLKGLRVREFDSALVGGRPHAAYVRKLGMPEAKISRGYDAVDHDYFSEGSNAARKEAGRLRKKHGLPTQYFFANTRFLGRKNIDGLLRAYALYRSQSGEDPWGLVVSGSGHIEDELKRLASSLGLGERVVWPGFLQYPDLPVYYGLASAFIHTAKREPWGLVLNEAASSGLPILSSRRVGAAHELLRDGANGFLFDPEDDGSMADAMRRIAGMAEEERAKMGRASRRMGKLWGPERFAEGLWNAVQAAERS